MASAGRANKNQDPNDNSPLPLGLFDSAVVLLPNGRTSFGLGSGVSMRV